MNFALSDEQQLLRESAAAFVRDNSSLKRIRALRDSKDADGFSRDLWKQMAELGWLGVTIPEQYRGSGGTMLDACLFMEETSRGLAPIGGYATTLIVAGATQRFGSEAQKEGILGGIASRLRDLLRVRALPERMPLTEVAKTAGLRFDWQARRYRDQARRFSIEELVRLHARLADDRAAAARAGLDPMREQHAHRPRRLPGAKRFGPVQSNQLVASFRQ